VQKFDRVEVVPSYLNREAWLKACVGLGRTRLLGIAQWQPWSRRKAIVAWCQGTLLCGAQGLGLHTLHHCWRTCSESAGRIWAAPHEERWVIRLCLLLRGWGHCRITLSSVQAAPWRGHLDFYPLRHKVCEDLRLDRLPGAKLDFKFSKLDRPLDDAAAVVAVVDDKFE
jgi:hypothetical protein